MSLRVAGGAAGGTGRGRGDADRVEAGMKDGVGMRALPTGG